MPVQGGFDHGPRSAGSRRPRHHNHVESCQPASSQPEVLSDQPLQAVAIDSSANGFAGDCETEPRFARTVGSRQQGQVGVGSTRRFREYPPKILGGRQPLRSRKAEGCRRQTLDGQLLAPFGATRIDDRPAAPRPHAGAKTMGANALDLARLIRSLHRRTCSETAKKEEGY